jgi:hypothetical protein
MVGAGSRDTLPCPIQAHPQTQQPRDGDHSANKSHHLLAARFGRTVARAVVPRPELPMRFCDRFRSFLARVGCNTRGAGLSTP